MICIDVAEIWRTLFIGAVIVLVWRHDALLCVKKCVARRSGGHIRIGWSLTLKVFEVCTLCWPTTPCANTDRDMATITAKRDANTLDEAMLRTCSKQNRGASMVSAK